MFDDGALALSLPAAELARQSLPGSVFRASDLDVIRLTPPLQRALALVSAAAKLAGTELILLARPDMFAGGPALAWLEAKLGGTSRHVALSDGQTVRLVPGFVNGVFFYGLSRRADAEALARLVSRAPELLCGLDLQVNSALRFREARPAPIVIEGADSVAMPPNFFPLALDAFEPEDGVARTLRAGPLTRPPAGFEEFVYVPLTEASLRDAHFMRQIADQLMSRYFDLRRALMLRLPETIGVSSALIERVESTCLALSEAGARPPIAPASGVWLATDDCFAFPRGAVVDLVAHGSFDFWRASPGAYDVFRSLTVYVGESEPMDDYADLIAALTRKTARLVRAGDLMTSAR